MRDEIIVMLRCPACRCGRLTSKEFRREGPELLDGVAWCPGCGSWFPVEDGILDLLTGPLASEEERTRFWLTHEADLLALGLGKGAPSEPVTSSGRDAELALALQQQKHFDWYASNETQKYSEYEATPFWRAADRIAFEPWKAEVRRNEGRVRRLLDVGCAQGRSTFHMLDLDLDIVGFDVSKKCVREATHRYREGRFRARASFLAADASVFPFLDEMFDYVLIYGVLHHLPNPGAACREVGRVLKPGGVYFGQENNESSFRALFDQLQKWWPIWHEEAGPEATISSDRLASWLTPLGFQLSSRTSVFLPPHIINWTNEATGFRILNLTDSLISKVPWLRRNGGIVIFEARK